MEIFNNVPINANTVDYTKWQTINGESLDIANMRIEYIDRCIDLLDNQIACKPYHVNVEVWKRYLAQFESKLNRIYAEAV